MEKQHERRKLTALLWDMSSLGAVERACWCQCPTVVLAGWACPVSGRGRAKGHVQSLPQKGAGGLGACPLVVRWEGYAHSLAHLWHRLRGTCPFLEGRLGLRGTCPLVVLRGTDIPVFGAGCWHMSFPQGGVVGSRGTCPVGGRASGLCPPGGRGRERHGRWFSKARDMSSFCARSAGTCPVVASRSGWGPCPVVRR